MRCSNCGMDGAESTGHQCPALRIPCRLCGSLDGDSTGHVCPALQPSQSGTAGAFAPRFVLVPITLIPTLPWWP